MKIIKQALKSYVENPGIILLFVAMYLVLLLFSLIRMPISTSVITDYVYLIIPELIRLLIYSFFFTMFIIYSYNAIKGKPSFKKIFSKKVFGNFVYSILFIILNIAALFIAKYSGRFLSFSSSTNAVIQASILFLVFALFSAFLLFSFFFFTLNKSKFFKSIWLSIITAKRNYLKVLAVPISYLAITFLLSFIPSAYKLKEIIYYVVVYPVYTMILTSLFISLTEKGKK